MFWDREGILITGWPPGKTTIKGDYYITELEELWAAIKRKQRGKLSKNFILQHVNARPHVSTLTTNAIRRFGFEYLPELPKVQTLLQVTIGCLERCEGPFVEKDLRSLVP